MIVKQKPFYRVILFVLLAMFSCGASADEVVFKNGDKLTGTIVKLADGKVTFKSAVAGEVKIAVGEIRSLATEKPVKVVLPDKSIAHEPLLAGDAGQVRIGAGTYSLTELRAVNPPSVRWGGKFALGLTLIRATTDENKVDFLLDVARTGARNRIALAAAYLYARSEDVTTTDTWFITGDYNFARRRRIYALANARLQQDRIQDLDLRTILGGGVGYVVSERPGFGLRLEGGLAWVREEFADAGTTSDLSVRLGYLLEKALWRGARLKHDFTIYPATHDLRDYYFTARFSLEQALANGFTIDLRLLLDYDATPAPDADKSTSKFILAVGKSF
jgi:Protein of unknown function, DUF481